MDNIELICGDCLEEMKSIADKSVNMVLCDLPYGTTRNKWDTVIPFDDLWSHYNRIVKDNGAVVLFGQDKFTAKLTLSNERNHRYNLVWDKCLKSGFLNANRMPLRQHEDVCVFYKKLPTYNPQKVDGEKSHSRGKKPMECFQNNNYGKFESVDNSEIHGNKKFPSSILKFEKPHPSVTVHPTQKPVELLVWLIKTYTNEGDLVLDNTMGSGSTGLACMETNRRFIGIEQNESYFRIAQDRLFGDKASHINE